MAKVNSDDDVKAEGWVDPAPQNPGGTNPPAALEDSSSDAVVPEENTEEITTPFQSAEKVAIEVAQGRWGVGLARRNKLQRAGYDPVEVNEEVKKILDGR